MMCATHVDTRESRDATKRVTTTKREWRDATVSRRVAGVVPPGWRVGGGDGDITGCC
jgi:hypothetical protein